MKEKFSKYLALLLGCAMICLSLAACGGTTQTQTEETTAAGTVTEAAAEETTEAAPAGPTSIKVGVPQDAGSLAPWSSGKWGTVEVWYTLYERLYYAEEDGTYTSCMVKELEEIDELTYKITLYDYIHDTEGNPIKAEDVVFSIESAIEIGNASGAVPDLDHVEVEDEYTVMWYNKTAFGAGMKFKEIGNFAIVSKAAYEASEDGMATMAVGSTPYKVTEYVPGSKIVVERTGDYWQTDESLLSPYGMQNVDTIEFDIILDSSQMAIALQNGSIDFGASISDMDITTFENDSNYNTYDIKPKSPYLLFINASENSICQDINLRKAIFYAIDNEELVAALPGKAIALTSIAAPTTGNYLDEWDDRGDLYAQDIDKAKEYLAKSSYKDGDVVRILRQSGEIYEATTLAIQEQLREVGITAEIVTVESAQVRTVIGEGTEYDIAVNTNGGGNYCTMCWNNGFSYSNHKTPISDEKLQTLLNQAIATGSDEDLNAFQDYVDDEMAYAKGLFLVYYHAASNQKVVETYGENVLVNACTFNFN